MILPLNTIVTILPNRIWPHLAGRTGVIMRVTPISKVCGITHQTNHASRKHRVVCGGCPIVEVDRKRYLLPASAVMVMDAEGAAA
jgi:hypothetical protein